MYKEISLQQLKDEAQFYFEKFAIPCFISAKKEMQLKVLHDADKWIMTRPSRATLAERQLIKEELIARIKEAYYA